jgi:hypothetical protein
LTTDKKIEKGSERKKGWITKKCEEGERQEKRNIFTSLARNQDQTRPKRPSKTKSKPTMEQKELGKGSFG